MCASFKCSEEKGIDILEEREGSEDLAFDFPFWGSSSFSMCLSLGRGVIISQSEKS